jgi:tripartite ATP-independent transporter DctM subunit
MDVSAWLPLIFLILVFAALFAGFPVIFTLAGGSLAFAALVSLLGLFDMRLIYALPSRIYGLLTDDTLVSIPLFVLMGTLLDRTKIAQGLLETMGLAFRRIPGGLGISVVVVGALLGACTGVIGATVATMALISLPTMLRHGYPPALACGLICAAGALTQVIPPATVLILLGDQIGNAYAEAQRAIGNWAATPVSVVDLYAGAMIPGLLLAAAYALYVFGYALVSPRSFRPATHIDLERRVSWGEIGSALLAPLLLLVAILGSIIFGVATATEGASVGVAGAILLAGLSSGYRRVVVAGLIALAGAVFLARTFDVRAMLADVTPVRGALLALMCGSLLVFLGALARALYAVMRAGILGGAARQTLEITAMVYGVLIGASFFSLVFYGLGGDALVVGLFQQLPAGSLGAMIFVQLVIFILGFPLENTEIISMDVPILAPKLLQSVDPIWFGVVTAVNLQTSYISPPVGFALFYLRTAVPASIPTSVIWKGAMPFLVIQAIVLAIVIAEPRLSTWLPTLLPH